MARTKIDDRCDALQMRDDVRWAYKAGAKWMEEQMFSLEDLKQLYSAGRQDAIESRQRGEYFDTMDEVIKSIKK